MDTLNTMVTRYDILIIDDNIDDYELCHRMLRNQVQDSDDEIVFSLRHAKNGDQGLSDINRNLPHCVLLDYSLPCGDGLAVLQKIRKLSPSLPIVVLTGQGSETLAVSVLRAGAQDYIVKSEIHNHDLRQILIHAVSAGKGDELMAGSNKASVRILIVDDNADDRELVRRTIGKNNAHQYSFVEASSGKDVWGLLETQRPDCILLDYSLPGEDGLAILKKISEHYPFIPVIIFSGQGSEYIAAEAIKSGAFHYLVKSKLTPELLDQTIQQGIEKKSLEHIIHDKNQEVKRHQYEAVIRKERFDRVASATNIVVWEYDIVRDDFFVDEQIFRLLGSGSWASSLDLKKIRDRVHPDDMSTLKNHWYAHLNEMDCELEVVYRMQAESGEWRWIKETGRVVERDSDGKPSYIAGLYEDITDKKHEEDVLNRLYLLTVDSSTSLDEKISEVLRLGLSYFCLDLGLVSKIDNRHYEVLHCEPQGQVIPGQICDYPKTWCSEVFGSAGVKAWHAAKQDKLALHSLCDDVPLNSYIGTTIYVNGEAYGTLAFTQEQPRLRPFSNREKLLLSLMAQWLSSEITREVNLVDIEESKNFLQLVQDSIPDLIFVKDEQFRIVRANPAFLAVYPEPVRDSIVGTTTLESYDDDEAEAFLVQDKLALKNGSSEIEETIQFPDGKKRTLHTKKIRFTDSQNKRFILGVGRDITEIKKAELDRKELHDAMTNTVEGISQINPAGEYIYVNEAYARACGYLPQELLGKDWTMTVDESEHEAMVSAYQFMLDTGKVSKETVGIRKDGSRFFKRVTMISRYDGRGEFTGHHCFMNDITESKAIAQSLAESQERYELAVKGSSVGLWDWNVKTGDLFWSDRFKQIVGISDKDFLPQYEEFSKRLHPEDKEKTESALFGHVESGTPYDIEYRLRRNDDRYVWVHARGQAVWDEEGNATRMAGSVDDISASKAAQKEILRSNLELERFAYVASHDLQEPLRMVSNFTQLLEKYYGDKLDARGLEYIAYAKNGASRMQHLVRDLLAYARIGNEAESYEHIDLNSLTSTIQENLLSAISQTGAIIRWKELPTIFAAPPSIRSVFQNLIGNAIKYRKSDVAPEVDIDVESLSDRWVFSIKDNGIGMKQKYSEKIFEPFKRLHRKEEYSGTGMGLSICRKTIEGLGGKLWVVSELGVGSTFYFSLPRNHHKNNAQGEA